MPPACRSWRTATPIRPPKAFIEAVAAAQAEKPRFDHRHFIVHGQLLNRIAAAARMATLGISATLFSNHTHYWGDFHRTHTFGAFRAAAMNPAATALRLGVIVAAHSDTPVSPVDPLLTMWAAVNRVTTTGRVQGPKERAIRLPGLADDDVQCRLAAASRSTRSAASASASAPTSPYWRTIPWRSSQWPSRTFRCGAPFWEGASFRRRPDSP